MSDFFSVNLAEQTSHSKGFSPVCDLMWRFTLPRVWNRMSHCLHAYGRSPVCLRMEMEYKYGLHGKILPH